MSYQIISLLSSTGKVIENEVAELLSDKAERRVLLSECQFGSKKKWSGIDPARIMVDRAHAE